MLARKHLTTIQKIKMTHSTLFGLLIFFLMCFIFPDTSYTQTIERKISGYQVLPPDILKQLRSEFDAIRIWRSPAQDNNSKGEISLDIELYLRSDGSWVMVAGDRLWQQGPKWSGGKSPKSWTSHPTTKEFMQKSFIENRMFCDYYDVVGATLENVWSLKRTWRGHLGTNALWELFLDKTSGRWGFVNHTPNIDNQLQACLSMWGDRSVWTTAIETIRR